MRGRYLVPVLPFLLGDAPPPPCPPPPRLDTAARPAPHADLLAPAFPVTARTEAAVVCSRPVPPPGDVARDPRDDVIHSLPAPDLTSVIPAPPGR